MGTFLKHFKAVERKTEWMARGGGVVWAWRVILSLVWSLCTWHGRKLTMKGASNYCLINRERTAPFTTKYPLGNMPERWVIHGPSSTLSAKWNFYMSNKTSLFVFVTFHRVFFLRCSFFSLLYSCSSTTFSQVTTLVCNNNKRSGEDCKRSVS